MEHVILADGNKITVEIPKEEYRTLVEESLILDTLVHGLLKSATLSWNKKNLMYDDQSVSTLLAVLVPSSYGTRLADLQKEQEEQS